MENFLSDLSVLLVITGILSALAVLLKQPVIIAYILSGAVIGPGMLGWVQNLGFIETISHLGVTLLLFLAGLNLHPQKLLRVFKKATLVTFSNSFFSFGLAFLGARIFGFKTGESLCIALALMFSSTILTVKLLSTTQLHHERMGAACIGVLIMQDLLAVAVLAFIRCLGGDANPVVSFFILSFKLVAFIILLVVFEQFVLFRIMKFVDRMHEVLFVLGLAWCLGVASISNAMGLFYESGAFFAGVVLARQPISRFIADKLQPLRDFFLVLFFFSLGAKLDIFVLQNIFVPAALLAAAFIVLKPFAFKYAFVAVGESAPFAAEAGARLGQLSEFSLLIAILAAEMNLMSSAGAQFVTLTTVLTFIVSSYVIVYRYPTPIGVREGLIKD